MFWFSFLRRFRINQENYNFFQFSPEGAMMLTFGGKSDVERLLSNTTKRSRMSVLSIFKKKIDHIFWHFCDRGHIKCQKIVSKVCKS